jgi:UDP-N-acetylmuramoyl-tripeptide--D-alanyl-D-alanine ligase
VAIDRRADWFATDVRFCGLGTTFLLQGERPVTLPRLGTHNVYNALFTIAAATELGVSEPEVLAVLARVPAAARRLEPKVRAGVTVFDDTYNMNPLSARAGLQALAGLPGPGRRIAVFGEMLELGDRSAQLHRELGADVAACGVDLLVCVGPGARPIAEGAVAAGMPAGSVHQAEDREAALIALRKSLREGDRVLCKASRRVQLDRLVDELLAGLSEQAGTEAG